MQRQVRAIIAFMNTSSGLRAARAVFIALALLSVVCSGGLLLYYGRLPSGVAKLQPYLQDVELKTQKAAEEEALRIQSELEAQELVVMAMVESGAAQSHYSDEEQKLLMEMQNPKLTAGERAGLEARIEQVRAKRADAQAKTERELKRVRELKVKQEALAKSESERELVASRARETATEAEQERDSTLHASTLAILTSLVSFLGLISTNLLAWRKEGRDSQVARLELEKQALALEKERLAIEQQRLELENQRAAATGKDEPIRSS